MIKFPIASLLFLCLSAAIGAWISIESLFWAILIHSCWSAGFVAAKAKVDFGKFIAVSLCCIAFVSVAYPLTTPRHYSQRMACKSRMRQITHAILSYHAENGSFPPPIVRDSDGNPLYSWRVLIYAQLTNADFPYHFDEPWDSNHNLRIAKSHDSNFFGCPQCGHNSAVTNYLAVVGKGAAWEDGQKLSLSDFERGASSTILLLEDPYSDVLWSEPVDLSVQESINVLNGNRWRNQPVMRGHGRQDFLHLENGYSMIAFADSRCTFHTLDDAEYVQETIDQLPRVRRFDWEPIKNRSDAIFHCVEFDYVNCAKFTSLVFCVLFPIPRFLYLFYAKNRKKKLSSG